MMIDEGHVVAGMLAYIVINQYCNHLRVVL